MLGPTHKMLKGRLYRLVNQAAAISTRARLDCLIQEWPLLPVWVMSMVEHLYKTLHQPLCMYYAQEKPIHSFFLNQSHYD